MPRDAFEIDVTFNVDANGILNVSAQDESNTTFSRRRDRRSRCMLTSSRVFSSRPSKGKRAMTENNNLLGNFFLAGIMPAPRGLPQVEVSFDIDGDETLDVSARDECAPCLLPRRRSLRLTHFFDGVDLISLVVENTV